MPVGRDTVLCTAGKTTKRCRTSFQWTIYVSPPTYIKKSFTARILQVAERGGGRRIVLLRHLRIVDVYETRGHKMIFVHFARKLAKSCKDRGGAKRSIAAPAGLRTTTAEPQTET